MIGESDSEDSLFYRKLSQFVEGKGGTGRNILSCP